MQNKYIKINEMFEEYVKIKSIELRNKIVEKYLWRVEYIAKAMYPAFKGGEHDLDDLKQFGVFGLIRAVEMFDPTKGFKFITYANIKIHGYIMDNIRKTSWVPRHQVQNTIKNSIVLFENNSSIFTNKCIDKLDDDWIRQIDIKDALKAIPPRISKVLTLYLLEDKDQYDVAKELCVSPSRVSQMVRIGQRMIRPYLKDYAA